MLVDIVLLIVGLTVLYFGAEAMVKGASQLALNLGIAPMIVGLTVVAFGTSAPEFVISLIAAFEGSAGISVGNIIGSNIANLALILGIAAVISPMPVDARALRRDYPVMLGAGVLFYLVSLDGHIERWEGGILFAGIVGYVLWSMLHAQKLRRAASAGESVEEVDSELSEEDVAAAARTSRLKNVGYLIGGLIGLTIGAKLMVDGAVSIAQSMGISDFVIGVTIVAFGTSLPELATSVVAAVRKESDISIGNVIGSNIFNVLFIMGVVPMIFGMDVSDRALTVDFPIMLGVTVIAFPLMRVGYRLTRLKGAFFLLIYASYILSLILNPQAG